MEDRGILRINIEQIHPHPDNPRKDLGDLTELADSIRKNGIMQNLTIIPRSEEWNDFTVIIGHRRLAAAKLAGITQVPCRIVEGLSPREEFSIMLEENMQRNDLTIYEQAQGFQMMLDLGETAETIAEKTGFSATTVRRRLQIAKLDKDLVKKGTNKIAGGYQFTLTDYYKLEKIEDVNKRNEILGKVSNPRELDWQVERAVTEERRAKALEKVVPMLEPFGVKKATAKIRDKRWDKNCIKVREICLDKEIPKTIHIDTKKYKDTLYWYDDGGGYVRIITFGKGVERPKDEWEIRQERLTKAKKGLREMSKNMAKSRHEYIMGICSGKYRHEKEQQPHIEKLWNDLISLDCSLYIKRLVGYCVEKNAYNMTEDELVEPTAYFKSLPISHQMLISIGDSVKDVETWNYNGGYEIRYGTKRLQQVYDILQSYGYQLSEEEQQILSGTHELYIKEDKK